MPRQPNPYRPGFNQPPGVLAGRDTVHDSVLSKRVREDLDLEEGAWLLARTVFPEINLEGVGDLVAQGALHPACKRDRKAALWPVEQAVRQAPKQKFLEDRFFAAAELCAGGQPRQHSAADRGRQMLRGNRDLPLLPQAADLVEARLDDRDGHLQRTRTDRGGNLPRHCPARR